MRNLTVWMQMSLDGYASDDPSPFDWPVVNDDLTDYWLEIGQGVDTFVYGRKIFEMMASWWPTADSVPNATPYLKTYSAIWRDTPKYVISSTLDGAEWNTTVVRPADVETRIAELKQQEGKDVALFGGPETTQYLIAKDLVDEYRLMIHPVVLHTGHPVFPPNQDRSKLELLEARTFSGGVIATHYRATP